MKQRKHSRTKPVPPIARYEETRKIERDAREMYYIKKKFVQEGESAAIDALGDLGRLGDDPGDASMGASATVQLIDSHFDSFLGAQEGRSSGGKKTARLRASRAADDYKDICERATRHLADGREPHEIAGIIKARDRI